MKQALRDIESMYKDIGEYDMHLYEFSELFRKTWVENSTFFVVTLLKKSR